ncbi:MAG: TRAP transporter small permease [Rhodobacteraceae bacterium]|nr:TRAP transporter small permease [Paracoccaceae bacterium]
MNALVQRIIAGWALLGGALILAIVLVTVINVGAFLLARLLAPLGIQIAGIYGYEDFVRLAVSAAALTFFPYCQQQRGHVTVLLFVKHFPPWFQQGLDKAWLGLMAAIALFLSYWMWFGMLEAQGDNATTPILGWSEWPWYLPGILSLILWSIVCILQISGRCAQEDVVHG